MMKDLTVEQSKKLFSQYASSSALHPRQWVGRSVVVSNQRSFQACKRACFKESGFIDETLFLDLFVCCKRIFCKSPHVLICSSFFILCSCIFVFCILVCLLQACSLHESPGVCQFKLNCFHCAVNKQTIINFNPICIILIIAKLTSCQINRIQNHTGEKSTWLHCLIFHDIS